MKIAISTISNRDFSDITALTSPIMGEYCQRHGYTFLNRVSQFYPPDIVWARLEPIPALMDSHDFVVHMDADVLITNFNVRIEDMVGEKGQDVATSENGIINDGVFIWGEAVWPKILSHPELHREYTSPQHAINEKYGKMMNLKYVEPRTMNSVMNAEYGTENPLTEWQEGDFCLHLPGVGNLRRVEIFQQILPLIQR